MAPTQDEDNESGDGHPHGRFTTIVRVVGAVAVAVLIAIPGPTVGGTAGLVFAVLAGILAVGGLVLLAMGKVPGRRRR